jgi:hypothetical protein
MCCIKAELSTGAPCVTFMAAAAGNPECIPCICICIVGGSPVDVILVALVITSPGTAGGNGGGWAVLCVF